MLDGDRRLAFACRGYSPWALGLLDDRDP